MHVQICLKLFTSVLYVYDSKRLRIKEAYIQLNHSKKELKYKETVLSFIYQTESNLISITCSERIPRQNYVYFETYHISPTDRLKVEL